MRIIVSTLLVLFFSCQSQNRHITIKGTIKDYTADSLSVIIFKADSFDYMQPQLKVPIVDGHFSFDLASGDIRRISFAIDQYLFPVALVKDSDIEVYAAFRNRQQGFILKISGDQYSGNELDSIDQITFSPPHRFKPFNFYADFIDVLDNFTSDRIPIDSLRMRMSDLAQKLGKKYYDLLNLKKIDTWFLEYRIKEIKANILYELMENAFGLNLTATQYESERETQILNRIHYNFSYADSLRVWKRFVDYAETDGLNGVGYMQYRFVYMLSLMEKWYRKDEFHCVLSRGENYLATSKYPINFSINEGIFRLRLLEIAIAKIKNNDEMDAAVQKIIDSLFQENNMYRKAIVEKKHRDNSKDSTLISNLIIPKGYESLLGIVKRFSDNKVALIDLWAPWCLPCINEFQSEPIELTDFLRSNNILRFYVAVGSEGKGSRANVLEKIQKYKLGGVHVIANIKMEGEILNKVYKNSDKIVIPRLLIVGASGEILNDNASLPSIQDGRKLIDELAEALRFQKKPDELEMQ